MAGRRAGVGFGSACGEAGSGVEGVVWLWTGWAKGSQTRESWWGSGSAYSLGPGEGRQYLVISRPQERGTGSWWPRSRMAHQASWAGRWREFWARISRCISSGGHKGEREARRKEDAA